jgi:LacI family transcriptional regulator
MARVTVREVAEAAGVSVGTVSRVMNRHGSVHPDICARVEAAVLDLGYAPDVIARSMRLGATHTVACAIRDIATAGFGDFVKAADAALSARGYTLILSNTDERTDREHDLLRTFTTRRVDGIVMTVSDETDARLIGAIAAARVPVVLMDRDVDAPVDVVAIDHRDGARTATAHLLALGHRRIALVTGEPRMRPARERIIGFREAFAAAGLEPPGDLLRTGGFTAAYGHAALSDLLATPERPTAVIAGGMAMLPGVLRAAREAGLRVPRDLSVVAGADTDLASLAEPAVTAVAWDNADWGDRAVRLLFERIAQGAGAPPRRETVPTRLVLRASCAAPP